MNELTEEEYAAVVKFAWKLTVAMGALILLIVSFRSYVLLVLCLAWYGFRREKKRALVAERKLAELGSS
jgi:hypothetical protein